MWFFFFFFQAEDGIRDKLVTGVQTCALPICAASLLGVAGLGIFSTGLAALVFFRLIDRAGPTFVSLTNYLVPVFAAFAGYLVFGEELSFRVLTGLAFILAGIAVSEWQIKIRE